MKNNRRSFGFAGLFATIGFLCCFLNYNITTNTPIGCVIWSAEAFAVILVCGFLGQEFGFLLKRKKFQVIRKRSFAAGLVTALIAGVLLGAVGQVIYGLEVEEYTKDKTVNSQTDKANISFLVDYSPSMDFLKADCTKATLELLEFLDEKTAFQFVAFTSYDIDKDKHATDLLPVNDTNRKYLTDFIQSISIYGYGTNFNIPLNFAVDALTSNASEDTRSVIVILTDCQGSVDQSVVDNIKNNNCELYVLTLGDVIVPGNPLEVIADKYFQLTTNNDGSINVSDVVNALKEAVTGSKVISETKTRLALSRNQLIAEGELTMLRVFVRIIFFGLLTAAAGFIYYGFDNKKNLIANFCIGAFAAITSFIYMPLGLIVLFVAGITDCTNYVTEEANPDV